MGWIPCGGSYQQGQAISTESRYPVEEMTRPAEEMAIRIAAFLTERGEAASSHAIADRFLKLSVPGEEIATRLLRGILEPAGLTYLEGVGWLPGKTPPGPAPETHLVVALGPGQDSPACIEVEGDRPGRPRRLEEVSLEGRRVVMLEPSLEAPSLRAWLTRRSRRHPASIRSLRSAVRGGPRIPRGAGLAEICSILDLRWLDREDPEGRAVAMAECVARAASWRGGTPGRPEAEPVELPGEITLEILTSLPETPGVYRFFDAGGELLYVGKAKNLRRRVSSHFFRHRPGHGSRFLEKIHRLEHEPLGTELEALLKEARLIGRRSPPGNVQLAVHERARSYGKARRWALLLPHSRGRKVTAVFVSEGRYVGHVAIGPRGGGLEKAGRLLEMAIGLRKIRPRGDKRDSEVLKSWLSRHGEGMSRVDLDSHAGLPEARSALAKAARAVLSDPETVLFR